MQDLTKQDLLKRVFGDPKHYPYGFSRSGDFSISESKALGAYGALFAALADGKYKPQDAEDEQYLKSIHGVSEPQSVEERAWLKYQKRINRPKTGSIYGTKKAVTDDSDDDEVVDTDDSLDLDIES